MPDSGSCCGLPKRPSACCSTIAVAADEATADDEVEPAIAVGICRQQVRGARALERGDGILGSAAARHGRHDLPVVADEEIGDTVLVQIGRANPAGGGHVDAQLGLRILRGISKPAPLVEMHADGGTRSAGHRATSGRPSPSTSG